MHDEPETYGPPAPIRLWTYRYWHPGYRQMMTLDTGAATRDHAFKKARRFLLIEQRRLRRAGITLRGIIGHPNALRLENAAMLRLIQSRQTPTVRQVIDQSRHAERIAMRWSATCPVPQVLAGFASSDALLLRKRLRDSIDRARRDHDAFWQNVEEQEELAELAERRAAITRKRPLI